MDELKQFLEIDWAYVAIAFVIALSAGKFVWTLLDWLLFEKLGIETKKMKQRREDRELLMATVNLAQKTADELKEHTEEEKQFRDNLNDYIQESRQDRKALHDEMKEFTVNRVNDRNQSLEIQKELKDSISGLIECQQDRDRKINELTDMFVDKEIDDLRYNILDFASSISSGRKFNRESYDHILRMYNKYEKILEERNMENGLVEESIKYIQNSYQELLKIGAVNY